MKNLSVLALVALAACGGSKAPKTTNTGGDMSAVSHDMAVTIPPDLAVAQKGDAGTGSPTQIAAACMNICSCFTDATAKQKCDSICVTDDSRYQTSFSVTASGKLQTFSGSFSYSTLFTSAGFFSGGSFSGGSGSSSGSGPALTVVPSPACLTCLSTATCSSLEQGSACNDVCPYLQDAD